MIEFLTITWKDFLSPEFYINNGGLWALLFIIFAETGLLLGFFLPGDSLLFVAGIYTNELAAYLFDTKSDLLNLVLITIMVTFCGVLGNMVGYWFGAKSGPFLYERKDSFLFKRHYIEDAKGFYEKHGGSAIVFARFLPIIRTFVPVIAGVVKMDKKKFSLYNLIGCIAWVTTMLFAGHYLQRLILREWYFDLKDHLEVIVIGLALVTGLPVLIKLFFGKRASSEK
ncbi:MAG TPA: VTT domain-containing protein [Puia sp.]|jgi:membrane-associated protein|nr:VTT domain-containing protein [Puia sp.]